MAAGLPFGPTGQGAAGDIAQYTTGDGRNGWLPRLRPVSALPRARALAPTRDHPLGPPMQSVRA
jgi:hypothetical protein